MSASCRLQSSASKTWDIHSTFNETAAQPLFFCLHARHKSLIYSQLGGSQYLTLQLITLKLNLWFSVQRPLCSPVNACSVGSDLCLTWDSTSCSRGNCILTRWMCSTLSSHVRRLLNTQSNWVCLHLFAHSRLWLATGFFCRTFLYMMIKSAFV